MIFYSENNVYDETIRRIEYLFDNFDEVPVAFSGGKDSTVILNLALKVAEAKGRLPLPVIFIDQEAEWDCVVDYMRLVMADPRVKPMWMQIPFRIFNATSTETQWLDCWEDGADDKWLRPKEEISYKVNRYGTDRFAKLFSNIIKVEFEGKSVAMLGGVRTEESPARRMSLTMRPIYKNITWGKIHDKKQNQFTFYPIYDWSLSDVWKAIHDNGWPYCKLYDYMYQYGIPVQKMRVSNVHHETAVASLFFMQEIEPHNWERLTRRISGINTAGQMKSEAFGTAKLPYMFKTWEEYRDYLLDNLITDEANKQRFIRAFTNSTAEIYKTCPPLYDAFCRVCVTAILKNDFNLTVLGNFHIASGNRAYKLWKTKGVESTMPNSYIAYAKSLL